MSHANDSFGEYILTLSIINSNLLLPIFSVLSSLFKFGQQKQTEAIYYTYKCYSSFANKTMFVVSLNLEFQWRLEHILQVNDAVFESSIFSYLNWNFFFQFGPHLSPWAANTSSWVGIQELYRSIWRLKCELE